MLNLSNDKKLLALQKKDESWSGLHNELPSIDEDIVQWLNALHKRNTDIKIKIENQACLFKLIPYASMNNSTDKAALVMYVSIAQNKIKIAIQDISCIGFLRNSELQYLPSDIICTIFEYHLDGLLLTIEQRLGSPIKIDDIQFTPNILPAYDHKLLFRLIELETGYKGTGAFLFDRKSLEWFVHVFSNNLPIVSIAEYWNLPVRIGVIGARSRFTFSEIKDLRIGDVILNKIVPNSIEKDTVVIKVQGPADVGMH